MHHGLDNMHLLAGDLLDSGGGLRLKPVRGSLLWGVSCRVGYSRDYKTKLVRGPIFVRPLTRERATQLVA